MFILVPKRNSAFNFQQILSGINFLLCFSTALQRHYGILEALALGEDEMPDIKDETWPDEEGLAR